MKLNEEFLPVEMPKYILPNSFLKGKDRALQAALYNINDRLSAIENQISKTARKTITTRAQQMLILHHLGFLDVLKNELKMSGKKQAKLLSVLLNASEANIEDDLHVIRLKDNKLKTSHNYKEIHTAFKESGLKKLADETDVILDSIIKSENK